MFFTIKYFIKRVTREGAKSLAVPLLAFTLIVLINTLGGIKQRLDFEYNNTMDNHAIIAELSDLTGDQTDGLIINMNTIDIFRDPESNLSMYEHTGEILLKRGMTVELGAAGIETALSGITALAADDDFGPDSGAVVTFFDGYDESDLKTGGAVCIISEDMLAYTENGKLGISTSVKIADTIEQHIDPELNPGIMDTTIARGGRIIVRVKDERGTIQNRDVMFYDDETLTIFRENIEFYMTVTGPFSNSVTYIDENTFTYKQNLWMWFDEDLGLVITAEFVEGETIINELELTVIGTVSGTENNKVYCPFWTMIAFLEEMEDETLIYSESLSVIVADNRELSEFKNLASLSFSRTRAIITSMPFAMTIYDSNFFETIEPLLQNTILVDIAIPIVYMIAVSVGFLASTLLTRQRKSEFAVLRSVGIHKLDVFTGVFSEQLFLSLTGAVAGCVLALLIFKELSLQRPAVLMGCYLLGTIFAAARVAGTNVLKVMKEE